MEKSNNAQVILVMDEYDAINYEKNGLTQGCMIISHNSEFGRENPLIAQLEKDGLLVPNNVLIMSPLSSPNNPKYYPLERASEKIHSDYFKQYSGVLSLLGAKKVSVTECSVISSDSSSEMHGGVKVKGKGVSVDCGKEKNEHQNALLKLYDEYAPTFSLQKAKKLVEEYCLEGDSELQGVIKIFENGGKPQNHEFELNFSQQLKSTFDFAATIKPYAGINIAAKIDSNKEITETYSLNVKVEFDSSVFR